MQGIVHTINRRRGMFVVQFDSGFAVFELLDGIDISPGDPISGNLEALGGEELLHLGHRQRFSVYGQSGPGSLQQCLRRIM